MDSAPEDGREPSNDAWREAGDRADATGSTEGLVALLSEPPSRDHAAK